MPWAEEWTAASIPERFEQQVRSGPNRIAIAGARQTLTYGQLDETSDRYAAILSECVDRRRDVRAAILIEHGADVVAAALAALKSGLTVLALNPTDPPARHRPIRDAIEPAVLLTHEPRREHARAAGFAESEIVVLTEDGAVAPAGAHRAEPAAPDDLAFLISTSGSTGRPKVVMQSHRTVLHNVLRYTNGLDVRPEDRVAWLAALSGGQGLVSAWTALLNGAVLCPFSITERGVTGLGAWLVEHGVTILDTLPSVLRNFARTLGDERIRGPRLVRLASEAGLWSDFEAFRRHFSEDCALASVLASSETGILSQAILPSDHPPTGARLTVGPDVDGVRLLLLAADGTAAGAGEIGEIVAESRYLSPGYWRDEALTAQRFEVRGEARRFHTGDLGQRSAAGTLTVLGRADSQVKVRGHRLQLEEVEAALAAEPGVSGAVITVQPTPRGDARLTAYLTSPAGSTLDSSTLRRSLATVLPAYAIPGTFMSVEAFPLTAHGKVDRERLLSSAATPLGSQAPGATATTREPASETEGLLLDLRRQAFEREAIGVEDRFLDLGGDSLTAAIIAAGVHATTGVELELRTFAGDLTVAGLAELIDQQHGAGHADWRPPLRRRAPPASCVQHVFWHVSRMRPGSLTMAVAYRILGPLDVKALHWCVATLFARHEILRTTFEERGARVVQLVGDPGPVAVPLSDLRGARDPHASAADLLASEAQHPFDPAHGPLVRLRLARLDDEEHQLLRVNHHLVADAISWRFFVEELAALYEARVAGRSSPLAEPAALQYADYAQWEWDWITGEKGAGYRAEVDFWERMLAPAPGEMTLPFSRGALDRAPSSAGDLAWGFDRAAATALDRLGREIGATYFMTRLAAFAGLLALDSGCEDFLVETFVTARRHEELQRMIGPLMNRALLRLRFDEDVTFRGWLARVRSTVTEVSANTKIPEWQLRYEFRRRGIKLPAVVTKFELQHSFPTVRFADLELDPLPRRQLQRPHGFVLGVDRLHDADGCRAVFDPQVHDPAQVARFLERMQAFAAAACAEPDRPLRELHGSAKIHSGFPG